MAVATAGVAVPLLVVDLPRTNRILALATDSAHSLLFAAFTLALLFLGRLGMPGRALRRYLAAAAVAVVAALATEIGQFFGPRDADPMDVVRNLVGIAAGLLLGLAMERSVVSPRPVRAVFAAGGLFLLLGAFWPVLSLAGAFRLREAQFPVLLSLESRWEEPLYHCAGSRGERIVLPPGFADEPGDHGLRVTFVEGSYPRVSLVSVHEDWTAYDVLVLRIHVDEDGPRELGILVHDADHDFSDWRDRYNYSFEVQPGSQELRVALADVVQGPRDRSLDLHRVRGLAVFAPQPETVFSVILDDVRLERIDPLAGAPRTGITVRSSS
jgi:hypothetical protein